MSNKVPADDRSATDQILDLLLDALLERQKARRDRPTPASPARVQSSRTTETPDQTPSAAPGDRPAPSLPPPRPEPPRAETSQPVARPASANRPDPPRPPREPRPGAEGWKPPARLPSIHMNRTMGRLFALVAVLVVLFNIPVTRYGVSLARIMPESSSLIVRDGLVLKGSGPEIYRLENDRLRWISSMDAFEHLGLTWADVHVVDDAFLATFEQGRPIHVLLKCGDSPHIYRLENNQKRWIKDIDTFLAEGHAWEDVRFVSCQYLRDLPTGPSIPEDAGPPPEP